MRIEDSGKVEKRSPVRRRKHEIGSLRKIVLFVRSVVIELRLLYLKRICRMDLGEDVKISLRANLDKTNPRGVHIGSGTYVAFGAVIFSHDMVRLLHTDTFIGQNCFIGANAIVMAGVKVGDGCVIGSGSLVTKDVPSNSLVGGNPARVIRSGISTMKWGILENAYRHVVETETFEDTTLK